MNNNFISHSGIIQNVNETNIEVMIVTESACASCKSKKVCSISEMKEKTITIKPDNQLFVVGEKVNVVMKEKIGFYAVLLAYILPFIIMISILFAGYNYKMSEPIMGVSVVSLLTLYFLILYLFRKQFEKKMSFRIEKQNDL